MSEHEPQPPRELGYRDGSLDRRKYNPVVMQFVGGIVLGAIAVIVLGVALVLATLQLHSNAPPPYRRPIVTVFVLIAIAGASTIRWVNRRGQFVLAGMLCGAAGIALIEGICFMGN